MEKERYIKEKKIAHRGVHEKYLENTIPAFLEAVKRGYAIELDIQFTKDKKIVFNEVNTIPGCTSHSRYPSMLNKIGISFPKVIDKLIKLGLER